jgi:O-methyltransferase
MIRFFKNLINKIFESLNYKILKTKYDNKQLSYQYLNLERTEEIKRNKFLEIRPEFNEEDINAIKYVLKNNLTMVSPARLTDTILSVKYAENNNIQGSFVECGTWRGGNVIAASLAYKKYFKKQNIYIYDTFSGMSEPNDIVDKSVFLGDTSKNVFNKHQEKNYNSWCYASLDEVKENFKKAGLPLENVNFIKGKVEDTLKVQSNLPEKISVLRLDTDWYESTLVELEVLYPKLEIGGVLLIDDYGYWDGAREAVENYFSRPDTPRRPFFAQSDFTGRVGIKI